MRIIKSSLTSSSIVASTHYTYIVIFCVFTLITIASRGIWTNYSYWSDELFSVAASRASWQEMFSMWVMPDTHPPLYSILLKLWVTLFGTSELATRSLSFLFASLALVTGAIFAYGLGIGRQIVVTSFLGSSPFFCYYAQETRSYSLVLFLSTVLTGSVLALRDRRYWNFLNKRHRRSILLGIYYISALLLSLTHYFALLFVVLLIVLNMIDRLIDPKRFRSVILLALISLWPIFHLLIWESPSRLARVSWIQVKPIVGTVSAFLMGVFPYVIPSPRNAFILLISGAVTALLYEIGSFENIKRLIVNRKDDLSICVNQIRFLAIFFVTFIGLMILIDIFKPMSFPRYYIVLLPSAAFFFGDIYWIFSNHSHFYRKAVVSIFMLLVIVIQLSTSNAKITEKITPHMNYKKLAEFVIKSGVCIDGCLRTVSSGGMDRYVDDSLKIYFKTINFIPTPLLDGTKFSLKLDKPLVGYHQASNYISDISKVNPDFQCWQPIQTWRGSTFIFLNKSSLVNPSEYGLDKCS